MNKVLSFIQRRKWLLLLGIFILVLALYFFLPRRLSGMCLRSRPDALSGVVVYSMPNGAEKAYKEYPFMQPEELEAFKELLHSSYARPKFFHVDYVNGGYEGYDFVFYENSTYNGNHIYLFTEEILVINDRQYVLYSRDFAERLRKLLHE